MDNFYTDIAIIGAGAAGLLCACTVAKKYKKDGKSVTVTVFEKQQRVGKKLLSTGNGRCNLTNLNADEDNYFGSFSGCIKSLFEKYPPEYVLERFSDMGLFTTHESDGRVYPLCKQATAVLDVLRCEAERYNVNTICEADVTDIKKEKGGYVLTTTSGIYRAKKVVVATGGKAAPKLGADVNIYKPLQKLGHSTTKLYPALCPVPVKSAVLKSLKGIRCEGSVTLLNGGKKVRSEKGEIQFTENALSGICVFNLSGYINSKAQEKYEIAIDLLPKFTFNDVVEIIEKRVRLFNNDSLENLFTGLFNKRIGIALLKECGIAPLSKLCNTLKSADIKKIASMIKSWRFDALPSNNFDNAQVTSGGIKGSEVNADTMESRLVKNLFFCGEVLDIYGDCGGYNLQFAFASALCVGENI